MVRSAQAQSAPPSFQWKIFAGLGLDAVVTSRLGGVSVGRYESLNLSLSVGDNPAAVLANRRFAAGLVGAELDDLVFCRQVHGRDVAVVSERDRGRGARSVNGAFDGTDALVTSAAAAGSAPGPVLVIMAADCVPLVLFDPVRRNLACVHAGWAGTVAGVSTAAVEQLGALGSDPGDLVVGIGPSIHPDRYQVGANVIEAAQAAFADRVDEVIRPQHLSGEPGQLGGAGERGEAGQRGEAGEQREQGWTFDLWQANVIQLTSAGVPASQIEIAGLDTGPGTPYFSHRSEGPCGRFAVLARITTPASEEAAP